MNRGDPAAETQSGLKHLCYASCKDLLSREQALVHHSLGILSDAAMRRIEACLKMVRIHLIRLTVAN